MTFQGGPEEGASQVRIPEQFFRHVLLDIGNLNELKLTLYIFWRLEGMEGPFRYLHFSELMEDSRLVQSMAKNAEKARAAMVTALNRAARHGAILQADITVNQGQDKIICANSPRGRAAVAAIKKGEWRVIDRLNQSIEIYTEHPNIYQLYESNIGPLTPLMADALRDAETTYQADWIEDAFRIAVEHNKRNWHYIEAILRRWQDGGRDDRKDQQNRRDTEEARRRYAEWDK
jgi:DNA replication protein